MGHLDQIFGTANVIDLPVFRIFFDERLPSISALAPSKPDERLTSRYAHLVVWRVLRIKSPHWALRGSLSSTVVSPFRSTSPGHPSALRHSRETRKLQVVRRSARKAQVRRDPKTFTPVARASSEVRQHISQTAARHQPQYGARI